MELQNIAKDLYFSSEDTIYNILEQLSQTQVVDKSLIYCFSKAFYLKVSQTYLENQKCNIDFEHLYTYYKENLKSYYQTNNPTITADLLDQILNFFDNSFSLIQTIELSNIDDSYEFRHYTIRVFEILRLILEKNSKSIIRETIFDNHIRYLISQAETIFRFWDSHKKRM